MGGRAATEQQTSAALALWRAEPGTGLTDAPSLELASDAAALRFELQRLRLERLLQLGQSAE